MTTALALSPDVHEEIDFEVTTEVAWAERALVCDAPSYTRVAERLKVVKALLKKIDDECRDVVENTRAAWLSALALKKSFRDPLERAEVLCKGKLDAYNTDQARIAAVAQAEAQRAAQKIAEEARLQEAVALAQAGDKVGSDAVLDAPVTAPAVVVQPDVPKVEGVSQRVTWDYEVTDLKALVAGIAAGKVPVQAVTPDATFLRGQSRLLKDKLDYPGVRAVRKTGIASRAG